MNLASVTASLDQLWRSQSLPMWLALAAAAFFAIIVLATLLRAEKSVANGALTVITLLAIGVAAAATLRGSDAGKGVATASSATVSPLQATASLPALSCLDDLAGDMVMAACEKVLFGSADAVAAAVSVSAARLDRLVALGGTAAADKVMTPDLLTMRRAMERDRYGLVAYVLQSRDRCMTGNCPAYASFTDHKQLDANMDERTYEGLVTRYAPSWSAPAAVAAAGSPIAAAGAAVASNPALAGLPATVPTGKPTTADFPSSSSIPPISIMTDTPAPKPAASANAQEPASRPAAKKQAAPKAAPKAESRTAARPQAPAAAEPTQLAPQPAQADN